MSIATKSAILFPIALLAMLALLTYWINQTVQAPIAKLDGSSRHDPDYIVSNFETTQTDINGALRYKLAAAEMKHFPDNDATSLKMPTYTQFAVNKPYTKVQGARGEMSSNGEVVEVFENVKVTREAFAEKGEMTLETDYLNIRPKEELVTTPYPVIIRQAPNTVIYATGMEFDKKNKTTTLLHKVKAHYERPGLNKTSVGSPSAADNSNTSDTKNATVNDASVAPQNNKPIKNSLSNSPKSSTNTGRIRRSDE